MEMLAEIACGLEYDVTNDANYAPAHLILIKVLSKMKCCKESYFEKKFEKDAAGATHHGSVQV